MINETVTNGVVVERQSYDLAGNRYQLYQHNGSALVLVTDRPLTAAEVSLLTSRQNSDAIDTRIRDALAANKTFLAIASPTNAQTLAQTRALTRQVSALIRKQRDDYSEVD
jgi:hypothetical protein